MQEAEQLIPFRYWFKGQPARLPAPDHKPSAARLRAGIRPELHHHRRCTGHNAGVRSQCIQRLAGGEDRKPGRMGFRGVQRNHN